MHVTACLAGQDEVDVEVGEGCRTLQALKEAVVTALPQLCVEGFDVSVGGRALDDDEGVVSLVDGVRLDVSANTRGLSVLALREAGCEVSEEGLLDAAGGDVSLVTLYLDAGVPIDCTDEEGYTPLHVSCSNGDLLLIATLLLDRGSAAIDAKTRDGNTPLHVSCRYGQLRVATLLLDRGSTAIDEKTGDGWTPLHQACRFGQLELARLLLDRGSAAIDEKTSDGWTPLHVSCRYGGVENARLLLDRGSAAIDEKDGGGWTPLHLSCRYGELEVATLLLDSGSTAIDEKDGGGWTPLRYSCYHRQLVLASLLLDRGCAVAVETYKTGDFPRDALELLWERGHDVLPPACAKQRRGSQESHQ